MYLKVECMKRIIKNSKPGSTPDIGMLMWPIGQLSGLPLSTLANEKM